MLLLLFAGSTKTWTQYEKMPVCSMRTALTHFLDITMPPSQAFLQLLATLASRDIDKERLELLAKVNALKPQVLTDAELLAKVSALKPQVLTDAELLAKVTGLKPQVLTGAELLAKVNVPKMKLKTSYSFRVAYN